MGAEASSDVTSAGPVKLADLQRILSNIGSSGFFCQVMMKNCFTYCFSHQMKTYVFLLPDVDGSEDPDAGMIYLHVDA